MEEGLGEEVIPFDSTEGVHLQNKDRQEAHQANIYSLKPDGCNMLDLESQEMLIPIEGDYSHDYPYELAGLLEGKNLDRSISNLNASEQPYSSPHCRDDAGVMVEELTVKNYDGSNLAIVGTSNNRGRMLTRQSCWPHLYQLGSGSGSGSTHDDTAYRDTGQAISSGLEDVGYASFPELLAQKPISESGIEALEELTSTENKVVSSDTHGGIRTKILSKSGFSEFFVKKTLKGKGIIQRGPLSSSVHFEPNRTNKIAGGATGASDAPLQLDAKTAMLTSYKKFEPKVCGAALDGVSMRDWLKAGRQRVNKVECLYIFRQIVELVDHFHSQAVVFHDLRPSLFRLVGSNQIRYVGSPNQGEMSERVVDGDIPYTENNSIRKRPLEYGAFPSFSASLKKQKFIENMNYLSRQPHFSSRSGFKLGSQNARNHNVVCPQNSQNEFGDRHRTLEYGNWKKPTPPYPTNSFQLTSPSDHMEERWYASPEELNGGSCTTSSNIYSLGVLLFELLGHFDLDGARAAAMSDLRHRILPPNFLSENPREAGFCLWLLHPEQASRPTTREILESEVVNGLPEVSVEELSSSIDQDDSESELLQQFLTSLREQKQKHASKLVEGIQCLEADMEEVERRDSSRKSLVNSCLNADSLDGRKENSFFHKGLPSPDVLSQDSTINELRLERNLSQLESVYSSMRAKIQLNENDATIRTDNDLLRMREDWNTTQKKEENVYSTDSVGAFFDGFCKYSRYSKFEVRGVLRNADFNSSSNVICSLSFDRDEDYFAAAGVSKKIKIFEFNALFNDSVDIHYPVVEMVNKSKLSCVCWNSYIKNYLASTDYDGAVKLWDASTGQEISQYAEHDRRAWSMDFSKVHPTKMASGSDDCSVKLWNINEKNCLGTIRNIANVCCVQFSAHSTHLLAFGSADYRTYCYDIRNTRAPWCVLGGHDKAVSYVKFLDSETLVSASTDNTLKLWNLNKTNPSGLSTNACSSTLTGHTNEKNFVGLSVCDGYIACGSETNEVYAYHRSLPMPITSVKFGSVDPISGKETEDDNGQFVSSVCWRGKSDMVVAANSSGCIKVLHMV